MGRWETTSTHEAEVDPRAVWDRAYADASTWGTWNPEIRKARLEGAFENGGTARVRFKNGARLRFRIVEFEDGRLFTDETRLPLARMGHRHLLEPSEGGVLLTNTIYIEGPLSGLWSRFLGRSARRAAAVGQRQAAEVAGA